MNVLDYAIRERITLLVVLVHSPVFQEPVVRFLDISGGDRADFLPP